MFHVIKVGVKEVHIVHELVHQIYYPTYRDILTKDQIEFMLQKSYTIVALQDAIQANQDFYVLQNSQRKNLGFIAVQKHSQSILRIEKLYLLPEAQGKGAGKYLISYAEGLALSEGMSHLELNVNRANKAYYFYLKQGFEVIKEIDIPYYGYVLDDYIMQKEL